MGSAVTPRQFLIAAVLGLAFGLALTGVGSSAGLEFAQDAAHEVAPAGGEETNEDPFHVSGGTLAVAILLPLFFVGGTAATFIWAIRSRARREEEGWEMPWWRTRRWYASEADEEEA